MGRAGMLTETVSYCREFRPHPTGFGEPLNDLRQGRLGLDLHFIFLFLFFSFIFIIWRLITVL